MESTQRAYTQCASHKFIHILSTNYSATFIRTITPPSLSNKDVKIVSSLVDLLASYSCRLALLHTLPAIITWVEKRLAVCTGVTNKKALSVLFMRWKRYAKPLLPNLIFPSSSFFTQSFFMRSVHVCKTQLVRGNKLSWTKRVLLILPPSLSLAPYIYIYC